MMAPMRDPSSLPLVAAVRRRFSTVFATDAEGVALAPGRVNLIGEHVDYNEGLVLPMAIDRRVAVAFRIRRDGILRAHSAAFGDTRSERIAELAPPGPTGAGRWFAYVAGVAWAMREAALPVVGVDLAIESELPAGAGLSSSAALETAVARALAAVGQVAWDPAAAAALCRRAENLYAGAPCGPMDQIASACAREGCALLLDCRSLAFEPVPLPAGAEIVVMDTGVTRELTASAYAARRGECGEALRRVRAQASAVVALRDVTPELLERSRVALGGPGGVLYRRARHVVEESARPAALAAALRSGDLAAAGRLLDASHASLRDLYDVSCPELDLITAIAGSHDACFGARLTGAGFGGCAVALVRPQEVERFCADVGAAYRERTGRDGTLFACRPAAGASLAA
jgi:galactokinase